MAEDIIVTSVKKILKDANLPLTLKFDNDKSLVETYKGIFGGDFPTGSTEVELVDFDTGVEFESSIVGLKFSDTYGAIYTIIAYSGTLATLNKPLELDVLSGEVVDLSKGDELKVIQQPSSYVLDRGTNSCLRRRVKGFDIYITSYDDKSGDKAEMLSRGVGLLFSHQSYFTYDTNGNKTGDNFKLELNPTFTDISTVASTKVLVGRVRFWKYDKY